MRDRRPFDASYVVHSSIVGTSAGALFGLLFGGVVRGRKPMQYCLWLGLNSALGSALFFSLQEIAAVARRHDDFLNSLPAGFFTGYALALRNSIQESRRTRVALGTAAACTLGHFCLERVRTNRLLSDDSAALEPGRAELEPEQSAWTPQPAWHPIRRVDKQEITNRKLLQLHEGPSED